MAKRVAQGQSGLVLLAATAAQAATFNVANLSDAGAGSLRQAIADANGAAGADTIAFLAGLTGTITLTTGQLDIADSVDIQGPGAALLTVSGNSASRVFYLYSGSAVLDVTISGLTLSGGSATIGAGILDAGEDLVLDSVVLSGNAAADAGGGLLAIGGMSLTIRDSTVSGNTAGDGGGGIALVLYGPGAGMTIEDSTITGNDAGSGDGGGLGVVSFYAGGLAIRRSTLAGNIAAYGGGLFFYGYGGALIENTTISGNQATAGDGGGALVVNYYGAALRHATIAANSATGAGGGIMTCASVTLENSLVGDNTAGTDSDLATNCAGSFAVRFSLVESPGAAAITDNGGNVFNQDAQLAALANNGGPTQTHLPAAASPVINTGDPAFTPPPATDQRGLGRVVNGRLDMGAVEVSPGTIQITASAATVGEAAGTVTITATRTGGADGAVSVRFDTADGTAIAPGDFTAIANNTVTLSWANQDAAAKSIQVTILNDALIEADETFQATISNPQGGAALGAITTETVTIQSEDVSVVAIPTLDEWGRLLLAGLLAAAAAVALRRRRDLAGPTLALALTVGALAQAAETAPKAGHGRRKVVQAAIEATAGEGQALRLANGQTIDLASVTLSVRDYRGPKARRAAPLPTSLADLAAFPGARIVLRTANDGTPRRVIFVIGASGASGAIGAGDAVNAVKVKTP